MFRKALQKIEKLGTFSIIVTAHALYCTFYLLTNHLKVFRLHMLPLILEEEKVPLMEWTAVVYISASILAPIAMFLIKQPTLSRVLVYGTGMVAVAMTAFIFYPIAYPREITDNFLLSFVRGVDAPSNCFPSLHVAACFFLSICLWQLKGKRVGLPFVVWSTTITVSTLTTKQHYLLDILAGGLLAAIFAWLATRKPKA